MSKETDNSLCVIMAGQEARHVRQVILRNASDDVPFWMMGTGGRVVTLVENLLAKCAVAQHPQQGVVQGSSGHGLLRNREQGIRTVPVVVVHPRKMSRPERGTKGIECDRAKGRRPSHREIGHTQYIFVGNNGRNPRSLKIGVECQSGDMNFYDSMQGKIEEEGPDIASIGRRRENGMRNIQD